MSDSVNRRDTAPSRRDAMQGATASALQLPVPSGGGDPALRLAKQYCWMEAEERRLCLEWQRVETWLFKNRDWPRLTEAEQVAVPESAALRVIEEQLSVIDKGYDEVMPLLRKTSARTREGLLARLEALQWLVHADESPDAHELLKSCRDDLTRLWR